MIKIEFSKSTVKKLEKKLKVALKIGNPGLIQKVSAILMVAKGQDFQWIAAIWCKSERTLYNWIAEFLHKGMDCFHVTKRAGRQSCLTKEQKQRLAQIIDQGPQNYGFPTACWNSVMIKEVIAKEFKVSYTRQYVCVVLKKLGFSWQKGKFISDKADPVEQALWRTHTWPELLATAKLQKAALLFLDEVGFPMWGSRGFTWARKGIQPLIKTSGRRKNLKVFGAIDYFSGRLIYKTEEAKLQSSSYIAFLNTLLARFAGPIIIVHDNAPYHDSREVKDFIASQPRLFCQPLPSYSPDYNLIEYLWKKAKGRVHNHYFPTFDSLKKYVHSVLRFFQKNASEILNLHGLYAKEVIEYLPEVA